MATNKPTRFTTLIVGATVVAATAFGTTYKMVIQGSTNIQGTASGVTLTAGGGRFQATNLANAACRKSANGRYYDCYQEVAFTSGTGGCVAAGCSTHSYIVAQLTKPYTGSGIIKRSDVTCDTQGKVTTISAGTVATASQSGSNIFFQKNIGSGALISTITGNTASALAAYSGAILWRENQTIAKVSAGASVGTNSNCLFAVWSDQMYDQ